ncbi:MAG: dockerin type I repeat-containing protein [Gemmatimonadota bacterium]|nr:dockerin type I repeat-containing protein [Gemmatimonadota bacterium]
MCLRGATGNRDDVILRGKGMRNPNYGSVPHVMSIYNADDVLIADLTVADAWWHNMHLAGNAGPQRPHIYNVRFLDSGEQLFKSNPGRNSIACPDSGLIEYCRFEFTDRGKHWYHNGVDIYAGSYWIVRDCEFIRIRGPVGEMCGPAILCFQGNLGTVVERNLFINCDVAIGLGIFHLVPSSAREGTETYAHQDAIIRNNIILRTEPGGDAGILVGFSGNYKIYNNTIILNSTCAHTILYGDSISYGEIRNNLTDGPFQAANDDNSIDPWSPSWEGAEPVYHPTGSPGHQSTAVIEGNITNAAADWFVDFENGDLHLSKTALEAIDGASTLSEVFDDYDGHARPVGALADIGADESGSQPLRGDLNLDGQLNIADVVTLLLIGMKDREDARADYDGDGAFRIADAIALLKDVRR